MDQNIADRRALRRKLTFWRFLTGLAALGAVIGVWFALSPQSAQFSRDHIARVTISGLIQDDKELIGRLERIAKSKEAKALIVDISSPGGTTFGGETIYKALRKVAATKPVVSNVRTLAASAAYMIAAAGDTIIAGETSITGSIGVIFQYPQAKDLMDKIGVSMDEIKSSPMKAEPSPFHPPSNETKAMIGAMVNDSYDWFVDLVAERRHFTREKALALADGSIFTGRQALENGLVDKLGDMEDIKLYLKNADIDPELPIADWKPASSGFGSDLPFSIAKWIGLNDGSAAIYGDVLRKFLSEKLFLDGLLSVWQVGGK